MYADGFTNIIDLAFDDDGNLLVLEIAHNGLLTAFGNGDCTGALIKVSKRRHREHTVLLTGPAVRTGRDRRGRRRRVHLEQTLGVGQGEILEVDLDD